MFNLVTLLNLATKGVLAVSFTALTVAGMPETAKSQPSPPSCQQLLEKFGNSADGPMTQITAAIEEKLPLNQLNLSDEQKTKIQKITGDQICSLTSGMSPPEMIGILQSLQSGGDPSEALSDIEIEPSAMMNYINEIQNILTDEQKEQFSSLIPSF
ncbi:MAG: hypothetical protein J7647_24295 [Cyanobacteria bacterium SBLK]|nr:hypothetical protein [Cyanobacteria bacterium SBLK]